MIEYDRAELLIKQLLSDVYKLDLTDSSLKDTPKRMAKMYGEEFLKNVGVEFTDFQSSPNAYGYDQIIMSDKIFFTSMCAHHFLPFSGHAWVLYIPDKKLVGASKMPKMIEHYAARPQLQEHIGHEAMRVFVKAIEPLGAMILMRAIHACVKCRGVKQVGGAGLTTSVVYGNFREEPSLESKGLTLVMISLINREGL